MTFTSNDPDGGFNRRFEVARSNLSSNDLLTCAGSKGSLIALQKEADMGSIRTQFIIAVGFNLLPLTLLAQKQGEYSGWFGTNNDDVQYQWRAQSYGVGISPDCPMRLRYSGEGDRLSAQVIVHYAPSGANAKANDGKFYIDIAKGAVTGGYATLNCNYINSVDLTNVRVMGAARQIISRPKITGLELDRGSIELLKSESEKLKLAGAAKGLLAWSPLIVLAGESQPLHIDLSIYETSWVELGESFSRVDKFTFTALAQDARYYANKPELASNLKLRQFWNAMADFYYSQSQR
jgi:hypothetical protein